MKHSFLRMEAEKLLRNRSAFIISLLIPTLCLVLLAAMTWAVLDAEAKPQIFVECGDNVWEEIREISGSEAERFEKSGPAEETVNSDRNIFLIQVSEEAVNLLYNSSLVFDAGCFSKAYRLTLKISMALNHPERVEDFSRRVEAIETADLFESEPRLLSMFPVFCGLFVIFIVFLMASDISSQVSDLILGERTWGTYDILRLSGFSMGKMVTGKALCLLILYSFTSIILFLATILILPLFFPSLLAPVGNALNLLALLPLFISLAVFLVGIYVLFYSILCTSASKNRVAENSTLPVNFLLSLLASFSYALSPELRFVPVANLSPLLQKVFGGQPIWSEVMINAVVSFAIAAVSIFAGSLIVSKGGLYDRD